MASIKVKFRPSTVANHEGTIYYQIIHDRKPRQLLTDYHIYPSEWDESRSTVIASQKNDRRLFILSIHERIRWDVERLTKIIRKFEYSGLGYTADDVIEEFLSYSDKYSLFNFMESQIIKLKQNGKLRTSETYTATLNSFKKFRQNKDIMLDHLTSEVMEAYEAWQKNKGNRLNTISFYTRILRAIYNRAVEEEIIENKNPFRHVYTGVDKTVKRALPLQIMKRIKGLDLSLNSALDYARDMFILSFMLRGMSFIDMAFLRKTDLENGYITYRRRKTGQQLVIKWTKEMQTIIEKYPENTSIYLLPIITNSRCNDRSTYKNTGDKINHNLKKIAKIVGVSVPLSLYVARHSWASIAKSKGVPVSLISEGMGHDSEITTQIYLASLDTKEIDKVNSMMIKLL